MRLGILLLFISIGTACTQAPDSGQASPTDMAGREDWNAFLDNEAVISTPEHADVSVPEASDIVWQGEALRHTIAGRYQLDIPSEWLVVDLDDPTFFTVYLEGETELASYLGNTQAAYLLKDVDVEKRNQDGIHTIAYLREHLGHSPPTTMNVLLSPSDPRGLTVYTREYMSVLSQRIGEEYVFSRQLSDPPGQEIAYSYHLPDQGIDIGFDMFFFQFDDEMVLITFSGNPEILASLHSSLEVIPYTLERLGEDGASEQ